MRLQKTYNILNEDFFDDSELTDEDVISELDNDYNYEYTYHIQFIIHIWPILYNLYTPEHKSLIESSFIAMKNALEYILKVSSIITDYSRIKFCTINEQIITEFPYMNNKPSSELTDELFYKAIYLETAINLSNRKTDDKIKKFLYSLWRLQVIYNKLMIKLKNEPIEAPITNIIVTRHIPYMKSNLEVLIPSNETRYTWPDKLINILNYKDETLINILNYKDETD